MYTPSNPAKHAWRGIGAQRPNVSVFGPALIIRLLGASAGPTREHSDFEQVHQGPTDQSIERPRRRMGPRLAPLRLQWWRTPAPMHAHVSCPLHSHARPRSFSAPPTHGGERGDSWDIMGISCRDPPRQSCILPPMHNPPAPSRVGAPREAVDGGGRGHSEGLYRGGRRGRQGQGLARSGAGKGSRAEEQASGCAG